MTRAIVRSIVALVVTLVPGLAAAQQYAPQYGPQYQPALYAQQSPQYAPNPQQPAPQYAPAPQSAPNAQYAPNPGAPQYAAGALQYAPVPQFIQPQAEPPQENRFRFQILGGIGYSFGSVGTVRYAAAHAHFDLFAGHDVAHFTGRGPNFVSLGYAGSLDVNNIELLHRHMFGALYGEQWLMVQVGLGASLVSPLGSGAQGMLGGFAGLVQIGVRFGNFTLAIPVNLDVYAVSSGAFQVTTISATAGVTF